MQCVNLASSISLNSLGNCKNTLHRHVTGYYRAVRHSSPYVLLVTLIEISKFWNEDGILLYCLPPHSSHITQPLDVCFFKPLKVSWATACDTFSLEHHGTPVSKDIFSTVFKKAWEASVNVSTIVNSFCSSGICPLNYDAIDHLSCLIQPVSKYQNLQH